MSATYNWAYTPGVANKYDILVSASADNVKPSNACYVALFGNDNTGNGSRQYPYKTMFKAFSVYGGTNNYFIFGSGVWREDLSTIGGKLNGNFLIGDGDVKIDYSFYGYMAGSTNPSAIAALYNITLIGSGLPIASNQAATFGDNFTDSLFKNTIFSNKDGFINSGTFTNCIFENYPGNFYLTAATFNNCTFYNISNIILNSGIKITHCIFSKCNISVTEILPVLYPRYSLFYQCSFRFNNIRGNPGATYPTTPIDFVYYSVFSDMVTDYLTAFPTGNNPFPNSIIKDPQFNNELIGDYSLNSDSPAKNLSSFGTYVGARSIAQGLKIRAIEAEGDFEFSTAVNVNITDNSIMLIDPTIDAVIETKVIENTFGREIKSIPIIGFNSDRNGQYIDSISDLATVTKFAGDALLIPSSYTVEGGSITYNGSVYTAGQRFTTVTEQITFSSTGGGILREILEAPQRHTIEMKFSNVQPFTTEAFNHFEPGIAPTTNNLGNSRVGAILRGNGDPAYVRGATVEFPVNSKYIKVRFTIRANNLKP